MLQVCFSVLFVGSAVISIDRSLIAIKRFRTVHDYNIYTKAGSCALRGFALHLYRPSRDMCYGDQFVIIISTNYIASLTGLISHDLRDRLLLGGLEGRK